MNGRPVRYAFPGVKVCSVARSAAEPRRKSQRESEEAGTPELVGARVGPPPAAEIVILTKAAQL